MYAVHTNVQRQQNLDASQLLLQALADYAVLIEKLKHEWESPDSAVIGFGGSYGGMLAAWFRMKYPNMLDGEQSYVKGCLHSICCWYEYLVPFTPSAPVCQQQLVLPLRVPL